MTPKKKILLSARDPGSVGNILALLPMLRQSSLFEPYLTASGVAAHIFSIHGEDPIVFDFSGGKTFINSSGDDPKELLSAAKNLLHTINPDIVIASLSSLGIGVDEALLATAQVPTFALQEFWGDVNLGLSVPAGQYLVLDDFAADLTQKRWGVNSTVIGAPKYTRYKSLDISQMRKNSRSSTEFPSGKKIIGWFGQSPEIHGHEDVFATMLEALSLLKDHCVLLLREHPKFDSERQNHLRMAKKIGISCYDATGQDTPEHWLCACDLVITLFSLCGLDHAYLSAYSDKPIGSVMYMMSHPGVRDFAQKFCGILKFPTVDQGLGKYTEDNNIESVANHILNACSSRESLTYFKNSKTMTNKFDFDFFVQIITSA